MARGKKAVPVPPSRSIARFFQQQATVSTPVPAAPALPAAASSTGGSSRAASYVTDDDDDDDEDLRPPPSQKRRLDIDSSATVTEEAQSSVLSQRSPQETASIGLRDNDEFEDEEREGDGGVPLAPSAVDGDDESSIREALVKVPEAELDQYVDDVDDAFEDDEEDGGVSLVQESSESELPLDPIFRRLCERIIADKRYPATLRYLDIGIEAAWRVVSSLFQHNKQLLEVIRGNHWTNIPRLLSIGGDVDTKQTGWYANIVTDVDKARYLKMYIGQACSVGIRTRKHKIEIKGPGSKNSLHYTIARAKGRRSNFIRLAVLPRLAGERPPQGLLNLVEMYFCLVFQTLPDRTLRRYLPSTQPIRKPEIGLNVITPLYQNTKTGLKDELAHRGVSDDPEVRAYFTAMVQHMTDWHKKDRHRAQTRGKQANSRSKTAHLRRGPRPGVAHEQIVEVYCTKCGNERWDEMPQFEIKTDKYLIRELSCPYCPVTKTREKERTPSLLHYPVDGRDYQQTKKLKE